MTVVLKLPVVRQDCFLPDAVQRIYELSAGVPRRINLIATNAILEGYGRDAAMIDAAIVDSVAAELLI